MKNLNKTIYRTLPYYSIIILFLLNQCQQSDPVVNFQTNERIIELGDTLQFHNESENIEKTICFWDFGDGNSSEQFNPSHLYAKPGDYIVALTVSNKNVSVSTSKKITVLVPDYKVYSTNNADSINIGYLSQTGQNYEWNVNGIIHTSQMISVANIPDVNTEIKLIQSGSNITVWDTLISAITITETEKTSETEKTTKHGEEQTPRFYSASISKTKIELGEKINYTAMSDFDVLWNFNNEDKVSKRNGFYEFETPGKKNIVVSNLSTGEEYKKFVLAVEPVSSVKADINPKKVKLGEPIDYSFEGTENIRWDFNSENMADNPEGSYTFYSSGEKTVKLFNRDNDTLIKIFNITVKDISTISIEEINQKLNSIANEHTSANLKRALANELNNYCVKNGDCPVTGKYTGNLSELITKLRIESNPYEEVSISVDTKRDDHGEIVKIILEKYEKREIQ